MDTDDEIPAMMLLEVVNDIEKEGRLNDRIDCAEIYFRLKSKGYNPTREIVHEMEGFSAMNDNLPILPCASV
jgi:hypothetical protein